MYVDLNDRKTGKTTRLIDSVIQFLRDNKDKTALIVTPDHQSRKKIVDKVNNQCQECYGRTITSYKMLPSTTTMKNFVDDFTDMNEKNLVIDKDSYYSGTYLRDVFSDSVHNLCKAILEEYRGNYGLNPVRLTKKHRF